MKRFEHVVDMRIIAKRLFPNEGGMMRASFTVECGRWRDDGLPIEDALAIAIRHAPDIDGAFNAMRAERARMSNANAQ